MSESEEIAAAAARLAGLVGEHLREGGLVVAATHLPLGVEGLRDLRLGEGPPRPAPAAAEAWEGW